MSKALLIIDMQRNIQQRIEAGYDYVHGDACINLPLLCENFRTAGADIIHVIHRSDDPESPLFHDAQGFGHMECVQPIGEEKVFVKTTSSAFASTELKQYLEHQGIEELVISGAILHASVSSTARAAHDLGFRVHVVSDAVIGVDFHDRGITASTAYDVVLAALERDYAIITTTEVVLAGLEREEALEAIV